MAPLTFKLLRHIINNWSQTGTLKSSSSDKALFSYIMYTLLIVEIKSTPRLVVMTSSLAGFVPAGYLRQHKGCGAHASFLFAFISDSYKHAEKLMYNCIIWVSLSDKEHSGINLCVHVLQLSRYHQVQVIIHFFQVSCTNTDWLRLFVWFVAPLMSSCLKFPSCLQQFFHI